MRDLTVRIDHGKCTDPTGCRVCLERCPRAVFLVYPEKPRKPGEAAGDWRVAPALAGQCTGCMICVEACPAGAIEVY